MYIVQKYLKLFKYPFKYQYQDKRPATEVNRAIIFNAECTMLP